eukprot:3852455-Pyramimonas_sp.AAC.1
MEHRCGQVQETIAEQDTKIAKMQGETLELRQLLCAPREEQPAASAPVGPFGGNFERKTAPSSSFAPET